MDQLTDAPTLASTYAPDIELSNVFEYAGDEEAGADTFAPATPSLVEAQEVDARLEAMAAEVEHAARHIAEHLSAEDALLPGADIDVALRMPRGSVVRRKGVLRLVTPRTRVTSPTSGELAHLDVGDASDGG